MRRKKLSPKWPKRFYVYLAIGILAILSPLFGTISQNGPEITELFTSYYGSVITLIAFPITINEIILLRNFQGRMARILENNYRKSDTNKLIKRIEGLQNVMPKIANEIQKDHQNWKEMQNLASKAMVEYRKIITFLKGNEYIKDICQGKDDLTWEFNELLIYSFKENEISNSTLERRKNTKHLLNLEVNLETLVTKLKNSNRKIDGTEN